MEREWAEVTAWSKGLEALGERLSQHFQRAEPKRRAKAYLQGLLSEVERKNSWQLAEYKGDRTPDGLQRLLSSYEWDAEAVRDDLRSYVVEQLGDPQAVLIVDETGFVKKGHQSVGVQRQSSGTAGRIENCQLGVFLAYASNQGCAFIDRALYLPREWAETEERRQAASIPGGVTFQTKPQLAQTLLARAVEAQVPFAWVTGDEVYGGDRRLRLWLEQEAVAHVLAIKRTEPLWAWTGRGPQQVPAERLAAALPAEAWLRLSAGDGAKGPRWYGACLPIRPLREPGKGYWLLVRWALTPPQEQAYYVAFGPADTPLETLVRVAGRRWMIETGFESAKGEVGLDHYEVRRWVGWYRHITLALLAHAFLVASGVQTGEKKERTTRLTSRDGTGSPTTADSTAQNRSQPRAHHSLVALATPPSAACSTLPLS
jgi:SRSO17 transposase